MTETPRRENAGQRVPASRRQRVALALIVAAALLARLGYAALAPLPALKYDALGYDSTARRLMRYGYYAYGSIGPLTKQPNAIVMPGYPLFLAAIYSADDAVGLGRDLGAARAAQALLGAATVLLVYLLAARFAGPSAGLVGALLAAAYPPAILAAGVLWTETVYAFLLLLALLLSLRATERPSIARFALAGAALALAIYVRPPALLWAPFAAAYTMAVLGWRRGLAYAGVAAAVVCLALAPWWARNAAVYGRFVPFNTLNARALLETSVPVERAGAVPNYVTWPARLMDDEAALNAYWFRTAMRNDAAWWRQDAADFVAVHLERAAKQVRMPWTPVAGTVPPWLGALTRIQHALLLVLGAFAFVVLPRDRRLWLLATVPVTTFLLYAATFPDRRYMYPNTPLLAVFAAISIVALAERVSAEVRGTRAARTLPGGGANARAS